MPKYSIKKMDSKELLEVSFQYLPEVTDLFDLLSTKEITSDDIYQMTLWKINRYPVDADKLANSLNIIRKDGNLEKCLKELLSKKGVGLPMASTYLRFCDSSKYQIIDVRALRAAFDYIPENFDKNNKCFPALATAGFDVYQKYLTRMKFIAKEGYHGLHVDFRNLDRFLYDVDKAFGHEINSKTPSQEWEDMQFFSSSKQAEIILNKLKKSQILDK
ncbi:MAG: hypothetical protein IKS33_00970 [Bacteroidales bacterium]|jgi:hypothetical protein|nr:hypothetical protein [Bacteroidales bacterium]